MKRQQMAQQHQQHQAKLDENKKRLEAANAKRLEDQKKKMEEMKQQQQALIAQRAEEQKKKEIELAQKQKEQQSVLLIRRAMQTFRSSTNEEQFKANKEKLDEVIAAELEKCGSQKERVTTEAEQAVTATQQRLDQIKEQKKAEEEKKEAENQRRREMKVKAEELLGELEKLVEKAETSGKGVTEEADPLFGDKDLKLPEVDAAVLSVEEAGKGANESCQAASDFVLKEANNIKGVLPVQGEEIPTCAQDLQKLLGRITETKKTITQTLAKCKQQKEVRIKRCHAKEKLEKGLASFKKADADKDNKLSRKEIQTFAKNEYKFTIPIEFLDSICETLVKEGSKGVEKEDFHKLKVMIGIARETEIDAKRKKEREAREEKIKAIKEKLQEKLKATSDKVAATMETVGKAETTVKELNNTKSKDMTSTEMTKAADEADEVIEEAKKSIAGIKETVAGMNGETEPELKSFQQGEVKKLENQIKPLDGRVAKTVTIVTGWRAAAAKKNQAEVEKIRVAGLKAVFNHQGAKNLTTEALYKLFDPKGKGKVEETPFVKFFKTAEKKEGEESISEEDASRLFNYLDSDDESFIAKEIFMNLIRKFMKVSKASVLTKEISIKSDPLRRLVEGEVVEALTGPTKEDDESEISRIKVKAMNDDVEGWVTPVGNQGTVFLEDGGNIFKVVKETILTQSFVIGEKVEGDDAKKFKDRKLKVGEQVEVREWARKEEASGLMRMKVRVQSDGLVGYATSTGNTGIVFLECM